MAILLGAREIVRGTRYSQLSGFRFYFVSGLVAGIPYLLAASFILVIPNFSVGIFGGAMLLSMALLSWEDWREFKAAKAGSPEWKEWDSLKKQAGLRDILSLLVFFDGSKKTKQG